MNEWPFLYISIIGTAFYLGASCISKERDTKIWFLICIIIAFCFGLIFCFGAAQSKNLNDIFFSGYMVGLGGALVCSLFYFVFKFSEE